MTYPSRFSFLAFMSLRLIDTGKVASIDEVHAWIEDGTLLARLDEEYPDFDISLYSDDDRRSVLQTFSPIANANSSLTFGVENNGFALLLGYCIEVLQHPDVHEDWQVEAELATS